MGEGRGVIAVYIIANRKNGTIYTGVTSHLLRRIFEHREALLPGFARDHGCSKLVWFEVHESISEAIRREKSVKSYRRRNKISLIEKDNPDWRDLWFEINRA